MNSDDAEMVATVRAMADGNPIGDHLHDLAVEARTPVIALGQCLLRIEESGPVLRELIARAADGAAMTDAEGLLLFRGLYILGRARDPLAFKPLLRLLRLPSDELDGLLGDCITEALSRIAAGVFDGDADALMNAIADRSIDEFVRNALFGAAAYLTWEGRIDRQLFIAFLERFHRDRLAAAGSMAWSGWLESISLLPVPELGPLVHEAFRTDWIDNTWLEPADFDGDLAAAVQAPGDRLRLQRAHLGYIEDVQVELEKFDRAAAEEWGSSWDDPMDGRPAPVTNPWRHVGRNDPCPCGSGRKAKKCCLGG